MTVSLLKSRLHSACHRLSAKLRLNSGQRNPYRQPPENLAEAECPIWDVIPAGSGFPNELICQDGHGRIRYLQITITRFVRGPAELLCDLWCSINPFPGYDCLFTRDHGSEAPHHQWAMNLVSGESLRDVMEVGGVAEPLELRSFGQMVFRAVRPNICRMTLSLDFAVGSGDDLENAIEDHVARLERRVDRFAEWFEGSSESREHDELPVFA